MAPSTWLTSFDNAGRRAPARVTFVTTHDGVTLADRVTYNGKDNKDGSSDNRSWNCGVEGPTDAPEVNGLRARQMRNIMARLILSQGPPMMPAGDGFGRPQQGNNNVYCQNSEISWLDWKITERGQEQVAFTRRLIA